MLRVSNLKLGIDEDISLLKKLILKKLKIKENALERIELSSYELLSSIEHIYFGSNTLLITSSLFYFYIP